MNKYELAVVVSAKLEDEARANVIEKVKALITRFGRSGAAYPHHGQRTQIFMRETGSISGKRYI